MKQCIHPFTLLMLCLAALLAGQGYSSTGRTVTLYRTHDEPIISGELISAGEGSVLIDTVKIDWRRLHYPIHSDELHRISALLVKVERDDFDFIVVEGESHIIEGALYGLAAAGVSAVIGAMVGHSYDNDDEIEGLFAGALIVGVGIGVSAVLIGVITGAIMTQGEKIHSMLNASGCDVLKRYAHFPDNDPLVFDGMGCATKVK